MESGQLTGIWLLIMSLFSILLGAGVLVFGRRIGTRLIWAPLASILIFIAWLAFAWNVHVEGAFTSAFWHRGWIWAISVGVLRDSLGLAMSSLAVLMTAVYLGNFWMVQDEPRNERFYSGMIFGLVGVVLSWSSLTLWFSFIGLSLSVLGGFLCLGTRWHENAGARLAARFGLEKTFGLLVAISGALILTADGASLSYYQLDVWMSRAGAWLLALGLVLILNPFPILGATILGSGHSLVVRTLVPQIFLAWTVLPIFFRLSSRFLEMGVFPSLSSVLLVPVFLGVLSGVFQSDWRRSLNVWIMSVQLLAIGMLSATDSNYGGAALIGWILVSLGLTFFGSLIEEDSKSDQKSSSRVWIQIAIVLFGILGTGLFGSLALDGLLHWFESIRDHVGVAILFALVFFAVSTLLWNTLWKLTSYRLKNVSWPVILSGYLILILTPVWFWTGTWFGEVLTGGQMHFMPSFLSELLDPAHALVVDLLPGMSAVLILAVIAASFAYWMVSKDKSFADLLGENGTKVAQFFENGYRLDSIVMKWFGGIWWAARHLDDFLVQKLWNVYLSRLLTGAIRILSVPFSKVDPWISSALVDNLRRGIEVPAKVLQLVQNGNVQWYLFFGITSGMAVLIHFMVIGAKP